MTRPRNRVFCDPLSERKDSKTSWGTDHPKLGSTAPPPPYPANWNAAFRAAMEQMAGKIASDRFERIEREILALKEHCKQLRDGETFSVPITTLAPEPFDVNKAFQVVVRPSDGEFIATLFDANLGMTGDTAEEAVANLKATIVDTFDLFEENEVNLGPEPKRQLAVLRELIQKRK